MMCFKSGVIHLSSAATAQRHTEDKRLSSPALCLPVLNITVAVSLMRERSVHFHPQLPPVKKMIDSVSGSRWLTPPAQPPTLFPSLCEHVSSYCCLSFPLRLRPNSLLLYPSTSVLRSLTSFTIFQLFAHMSYSLYSFHLSLFSLVSSVSIRSPALCVCHWIGTEWGKYLTLTLEIWLFNPSILHQILLHFLPN